VAKDEEAHMIWVGVTLGVILLVVSILTLCVRSDGKNDWPMG
jgi:cytochrome bd-type quinol oxidase subunit 1